MVIKGWRKVNLLWFSAKFFCLARIGFLYFLWLQADTSGQKIKIKQMTFSVYAFSTTAVLIEGPVNKQTNNHAERAKTRFKNPNWSPGEKPTSLQFTKGRHGQVNSGLHKTNPWARGKVVNLNHGPTDFKSRALRVRYRTLNFLHGQNVGEKEKAGSQWHNLKLTYLCFLPGFVIFPVLLFFIFFSFRLTQLGRTQSGFIQWISCVVAAESEAVCSAGMFMIETSWR